MLEFKHQPYGFTRRDGLAHYRGGIVEGIASLCAGQRIVEDGWIRWQNARRVSHTDCGQADAVNGHQQRCSERVLTAIGKGHARCDAVRVGVVSGVVVVDI